MSTQNLPTHHYIQYASYLVRLWRDDPDAPWRGSAQSVQNGKTVNFATIEDLVKFLRDDLLGEQGSDSPDTTQNQSGLRM